MPALEAVGVLSEVTLHHPELPFVGVLDRVALVDGLVEVVDFNERGPVLAVRPYTHTDHYWQVFFDTNKVIADTFGAAGYPVPEAHVRVVGQS